MPEYQILNSEPGYKVRGFRDEFLERRRMTIDAMRPQLRILISGLLSTIESLKIDDPLIDMNRVRIEETKWTKDGQLVLSLSTLGLLEDIKPDRYYVDELVGELVERDDHFRPVSGEVGQFISAMIDQFGFIKKNNDAFDPTKVEFTQMHWNQGRLVFNLEYDGKPMSPQEARW
jgi:hypothetical protein